MLGGFYSHYFDSSDKDITLIETFNLKIVPCNSIARVDNLITHEDQHIILVPKSSYIHKVLKA